MHGQQPTKFSAGFAKKQKVQAEAFLVHVAKLQVLRRTQSIALCRVFFEEKEVHGDGIEPSNALSGRVLNPVGLTTPQPVQVNKVNGGKILYKSSQRAKGTK